MDRCRLCGSIEIRHRMHLDRLPRDVQHLLTDNDLDRDHSTEIDIYQCSDCGLVQSPMLLDPGYYDDYFMTQTFSSQMQEYLDDLVDSFLTTWGVRPGRVLDVGCGDGAFMAPFQRRGITVSGIEPSVQGRARALAQGYKVHAGYISADREIPDSPYDLIVSRQVLEHVDDIRGFLQGMRRNLSGDGYVLIEVPRLEKALEDRRFYDFFPDHVNYFSLATLRTALETNGFDVLETKATMYDEYNVAIARVRAELPFDTVLHNRENLLIQIQDLLDQSHDHGVAIWGAGAKGLAIMSKLDTTNLSAVVDSDPNKIGRFTPVSHVLIQDSSILIKQHIGTVIISAVAFQRPILEKLSVMGYQGRILTITQQGLGSPRS